MMAAFNPGPNGTDSMAFPRALAENTQWPFEYTQREKMNLKNTLLCGLLSFSVSSFEGPHVILNCFKERNGHSVVAPNCNPSTWEPKARSQVVGWAT